jgi:hypothetical protein
MRVGLAFRAFFAALGGKRLPLAVIPAELIPDPTDEKLLAEMRSAGLLPEGTQPRLPAPEGAETEAPPAEAAAAPSEVAPDALAEAVAAQTLGLFQAEGRLLDFLAEDISEYPDADVGQVVREVHRGCKKALDDHFTLEPVRPEQEEADVTIGADFEPGEIRLVGNVVGEPPFTGTLKHAGYRATHVRLPRIRTGASATVVVPAEVEI